MHPNEIRRLKSKEGRGSPRARVSARCVAGVELRRASGEFWVAALSRRASARQGGLGNMYSALDCFQKEGMRTAGGVASVGEAQPRKNAMICCGLNQKKNIRGGRWREREEIGERRRRGVHWQGQNRPGTSAGARSSDEQLRGLAASRAREEKGKRRGG
jgi:hypothetical protein